MVDGSVGFVGLKYGTVVREPENHDPGCGELKGVIGRWK